MRVQPITANQQASFLAKKLPKLKIKPRVNNQLKYEQERDRNYTQAIMFGLAFIAASFTKYFIDLGNSKHKQTAKVEIPAGSTPEQTVEKWNK